MVLCLYGQRTGWMKEQWMKRQLNGGDNPFDVTQWHNWAAREGKKEGKKERPGHCGSAQTSTSSCPPSLLESLTSTAMLIESAGIYCPLGTNTTWCHAGDSLDAGLTNQVLISTVLSLTRHTSEGKLTHLLHLAWFIDRPHQERPGSPKQCLHSCQPATHAQTLAYITPRYWM